MNMHTRNQQQGVALVVSLIILVSLTMLGLTSVQRTTTDLSMAGNTREAGMMFHAAEVGLIAAENYIGTSTTNSDYTVASAGRITVPPDNTGYFSPNYYDSGTWVNSSLAPTSMASTFYLKEEPRYMIEYLGNRFQNPLAAPNIGGGYGSQTTGDIVSIYRATARGVGLTGNSFRFVQSYVGKKAP